MMLLGEDAAMDDDHVDNVLASDSRTDLSISRTWCLSLRESDDIPRTTRNMSSSGLVLTGRPRLVDGEVLTSVVDERSERDGPDSSPFHSSRNGIVIVYDGSNEQDEEWF